MTHFNFLILMISKCFSVHNFMWRAYTVDLENNFTDARVTHNKMIFTSPVISSELVISQIQINSFFEETYYDMIILILNIHVYHITNPDKGIYIPLYRYSDSLKIINPQSVLKIENEKNRVYNLQYVNLMKRNRTI